MSKNMESKPTTPSVIARLMGLNELPSQQPVKKQKQQRVLSENYMLKVASIGVWEKRSFDECHSFRFSAEEQKKFRDTFEVVESLERDQGTDLFAAKERVESNNERCPSFRKIVILKPKPGEAENAANCLYSPSSSEDSNSGYRKDQGFLSRRRGNSHVQVKERKNFSFGVQSTGHRSILSCETDSQITRKIRHNISDISLEPPRSGFSGVHSLTKEPEFMMVSSSSNRYKPSRYYLDGSYVAQEAKKQILERCKMTKEFRENGLTIGGRVRSRTLGEMLALPADHEKCAHFCSPLGISSGDCWKNGGVGDLIKSRSPAYATSVQSPITRTSHKAFHDYSYMTTRPIFSLNWSRLKSSKQGSSGKDGLKQRNSGSNCRKSQSSPYLESEKSHLLEDKYIIHEIFENNLEKQDSFEENSLVSKSLKQDIVHSDFKNRITPIDQWNDIQYGNMSAKGSVVPKSSMCTAASPSIASDMVVAVETVPVGKPTGNHKQQQFASTDSTMLEKDCASNQQPSPVSVLEVPFGEEILSSSKSFQSVSASLHDVKRQLEFLKSESLEEYSEGPGMIVSSDDDDDDAGGESLEDCEVNEDFTRFFGFEQSRDFSYLVDVLTEAGFQSRNQDIGIDGWHSPEIPISPSVFDTLEKKYGEEISWKRSARRLLFDRINSGIIEILQPCLGEPMWAKPVARRLSYKQNLKEIEEELYMLIISQEKEARKDSSEKVLGKDDGWLFLGFDVEVIGREIENSLIDELVAEIVSLESFRKINFPPQNHK
ncbi:hypothetical protein REPUB_Repub03eG0200200 [Reevesia pubescens]